MQQSDNAGIEYSSPSVPQGDVFTFAFFSKERKIGLWQSSVCHDRTHIVKLLREIGNAVIRAQEELEVALERRR